MSSSSPNSSFAPFTPTLPTGYVLRDYIIEEVLGQGGFGITYLAKEEMTDYPVVFSDNYPITHRLTNEEFFRLIFPTLWVE